jgi:phosphoglycolate phosphatase-like HAD superfamily hydrolase
MSSPREFKAVFFDLDGTLVDIHGPLYLAVRKALGDLGEVPPLTRERYDEAIKQDDPLAGVPEHKRAEYMQLALAYFLVEIDRTERLEVLPHVHETLSGLRRRGYATGVITSRPGDPQRLVEKLAMVGLAPFFDQVITQTGTGMEILDKTQSLRDAAANASVPAADCMYVGDEPRDVMAATNAGYGASVAVATGPANYRMLSGHPKYRADFVMRSMAELIDLLDRLKSGNA